MGKETTSCCLPARLSLFHETALFCALLRARIEVVQQTVLISEASTGERTWHLQSFNAGWLVACALMRRKSAGGPKTLVETEALSLCIACKGIALRNSFCQPGND